MLTFADLYDFNMRILTFLPEFTIHADVRLQPAELLRPKPPNERGAAAGIHV